MDRQLGRVEEEASYDAGQLQQVRKSPKMGVVVLEEAVQEEVMTEQVVLGH